MKCALFADIGSTFTKVTAVDLDECAVIGRAMSPTTVSDDVCLGFDNALAILEKHTGKLSPHVTMACSSAAGGLKMVACGLVPELTAEAARLASLSAGAKVLASFSYKLSEHEVGQISALRPEIIMLCGGTDGGNSEVITHNAAMLAHCEGSFTVIVAGNKSATEECVEQLTKGGKNTVSCENVMPEFGKLNIDPARQAVRKVFLDRIVHAKGLDRLVGRVQGDIIPTPASILDAMSLLSNGVPGKQEGIGSLMAFDIGGATTDVYSVTRGCPIYPGAVLKGIPHPGEKRTVEGDLGMRWNAKTIVSHFEFDIFAEEAGVSPEKLREALTRFEKSPEALPEDTDGIKIDTALAKAAIRLSAERHAGSIETIFTPLGEKYMQTGKDLSEVRYLIGTGGSIICSEHPLDILAQGRWQESSPFSLLPKQAKPVIDSSYILSAMGLLSREYPEIALEIMKKHVIGEQNL